MLAAVATEVDLAPITEGQAAAAAVRGKLLFVWHPSATGIAGASTTPMSGLMGPASDQSRVQRDAWPAVPGFCPRLGCIPLGQSPMDNRSDYGGWCCPRHGSHYDTSRRIRVGLEPTNPSIPTYTFTSPTQKVLVHRDETYKPPEVAAALQRGDHWQLNKGTLRHASLSIPAPGRTDCAS